MKHILTLCLIFTLSKAQTYIADPGFTKPTQIDALPYSILDAGNGKWWVGGEFNDHLIRMNDDGTVDNTFTKPAQIDNSVTLVADAGNGKIWVGGFFSDHLLRLNADGTVDNTFTKPTEINSWVWSITDAGNGKWWIGGSFSAYLIRMNADGTVDNTFTKPGIINNWVWSITDAGNGKWWVGGSFAGDLIRLNANGTVDNTFTKPLVINGSAVAITAASSNRWWVGGVFNDDMLRINAAGTVDNTFTKPAQVNNWVYCIASAGNGKWWVGGDFSSRLIRMQVDCGGQNLTTPTVSHTIGCGMGPVTLQNTASLLAGETVEWSSDQNDFSNATIGNSISLNIPIGSDSTLYVRTANGTGCYSPTFAVMASAREMPTLPTISQTGNTLEVPASGLTLEWLDENQNAISGASGSSFNPPASGSYYLKVSNTDCADTTEVFEFIATSRTPVAATRFTLYPNPARDVLHIQGIQGEAAYRILSLQGTLVQQGVVTETLNLQPLAKGTYILELAGQRSRFVKH